MKMLTFKRGGAHVPENKHLSEHQTISDVELPDLVTINLGQHPGKPARAIVKVRQEVAAGEALGEADGFISAPVHASVSGMISKIERRLNAVGSLDETVVIDVNKEKTALDYQKFQPTGFDLNSKTPKELVAIIKNAGIVGEGGATFPTHVKLSPPPDKKIQILIINGAECEPYLTADHQLMIEKTAEILKGARIVQSILGVQNACIGIETNKLDAIRKFEDVIREEKLSGVEVIPLHPKYPQGGEKQLIQAITGREVPSGKLPFDVGVVVQNVGTVHAIFEACYFGKPLIDRVVTVTGFVNKPGNYKAPIGVSFEHVIMKAAGGFRSEDRVKEVINGGPMMGKAVRQLDVAIMKGTSGILVLSDSDFHYEDEGPCIRCGRCIDICPAGLMPASLASSAQFKITEELSNAMDCIECGSCSYVCPTRRQLVHWIRLGKQILRAAK